MSICDETVPEATGPPTLIYKSAQAFEWPGVEAFSRGSLQFPKGIILLFILIMIKMFSSKLEYQIKNFPVK